MDVELKPCPFCGNSCATVTNTREMERPSACFMYTVVCDATQDGCGTTMGYAFEKDEAINAWNNRHGAGDAEAWQTIESAPKDGTKVLLCHSGYAHPFYDRDRMPRVWVDFFRGGSWYNTAPSGLPTHWRPLPAPPNDDAARAGERG